MMPQSSHRHVTASGSAFLADLSLSPAAEGGPEGKQLEGPIIGSLGADSSSSTEESEKAGEAERGEREGLYGTLRAMGVTVESRSTLARITLHLLQSTPARKLAVIQKVRLIYLYGFWETTDSR